MTICAAANINDQGICLVADSIVTMTGSPVTSQVIVSKDGEVIEWEPEREGMTSKGETFQPILRDEFTCYGEGACKLARFGPDMFAAFSGNVMFCESLAEAMTLSAEKIEQEASVALNQPGWEGTRGMIIPNNESYIKSCAERVVARGDVSNGAMLEMLIAAKTVLNKPSLLKAHITQRSVI